ncbi:MAG: twin-arginine translocation signal domain-containing protein [Planctomycetota bacterium]|jgi:hypothetical protein
MNRRTFLKRLGAAALAAGTVGRLPLEAVGQRQKPNLVIIFTDDQGYALQIFMRSRFAGRLARRC